MRDETLLKLSLGIAVIGLLGLFWYGTASSTGYSVSELDQMLGQKVCLAGTASSVFTSKAGNTFFQLSDGTGQVSVAIFKNSNLDIADLKNGVSAEVEGRVAEYEGSLEVIAEAIRILPPSQAS